MQREALFRHAICAGLDSPLMKLLLSAYTPEAARKHATGAQVTG